MTAATVAPALPTRAGNSLLRLAVALALAVVVVAGAFAIGRSSADTTEPAAPAEVTPANVAPTLDPVDCGHTAHTPPC